MQLASLRAYCLVGETGSFSEAAEKHGVTTSAMSQTLAHLEKTLGARLLTRGRHGPGKLTRAGQVAYEAASNIVRLSGELHRELRRTRESAVNDRGARGAAECIERCGEEDQLPCAPVSVYADDLRDARCGE